MTVISDIVILNVDDQDAPRYVKTRDLQEAGFSVISGGGPGMDSGGTGGGSDGGHGGTTDSGGGKGTDGGSSVGCRLPLVLMVRTE